MNGVGDRFADGAGDAFAQPLDEGTKLDASGTYTYTNYTTNPNGPAPEGNFNWWVNSVTETRPDGTKLTVYTNQAGEVMLDVLQAFTLNASDVETPQTWLTGFQYDSQGRMIAQINPTALGGFEPSSNGLFNGLILPAQGEIMLYDYNADGYLADTSLEHGLAGTPILQSSFTYTSQTSGNLTVRPLESQTVFRNDDGTGDETTSYAYPLWDNLQPLLIVTSLPEVTADQNGPGTAATQVSQLDEFGRQVVFTDANDHTTDTQYDDRTGTVLQTVVDAGGLNLTTRVQSLDFLGRPTAVIDPNGIVTKIQYVDNVERSQVITTPEVGPVQVVTQDRLHGYTETETFDPTTRRIQSLTRTLLDRAGRSVQTVVYFNLSGLTYDPSQVFGTLSTNANPQAGNYYQTLIGYDQAGRQSVVTNAVGTITLTVFDGLGRAVNTLVGTSMGNLTLVQNNVYDEGKVGDSDLTETTQYPGGGAMPRETDNFFDWRDRQVASETGVGAWSIHPQGVYCILDNLGECIEQEQFDETSDPAMGPIVEQGGYSHRDGPLQPRKADLTALTANLFDNQGRLYRTLVFDVSPVYRQGQIVRNNVDLTNFLQSDTWYDLAGNVIQTHSSGQPTQKTIYDGANRPIEMAATDGGAGLAWQAATGIMPEETVLQETAHAVRQRRQHHLRHHPPALPQRHEHRRTGPNERPHQLRRLLVRPGQPPGGYGQLWYVRREGASTHHIASPSNWLPDL